MISLVFAVLPVAAQICEFEEDFDGSLLPRWVHDGDGSVTIVDGVAHFEVGDGTVASLYDELMLTTAACSYEDVSITADVRDLESTVDKILGVRVDPDAGVGYFANLRSAPFDDLSLVRRTSASSELLAQIPYVNSTETWYRMELRIQGGRLSISIDGSEQISVEDPDPLSAGAAGFRLITGGNVYYGAAEVDDVVVANLVPRASFASGATGLPGSASSVSWTRLDAEGGYHAYLTRRDLPNVLIEPLAGGGVSTATPTLLADAGAATAALWMDDVTPGLPEPLIVRRHAPGSMLIQLPGQGFAAVPANPVTSTMSNRTAVVLDHDRDGQLEILLGRVDGETDLLFELGASDWTDVTPAAMAKPLDTAGIAPGDYDNDGDLDLYFVYFDGPNALLRNDGDGNWTDVTPPLLADPYAGLSAAWGDYDNDGRLDLFLTNSDDVQRIYHNDGGGAFSGATPPEILTDSAFSENASWVDVDNDGRLDLFYTRRNLTDRLWRNTGSGFAEVVDSELHVVGNHTGAAWADADADGDLDLFVAEYESDAESRYLINELPPGRSWVEIDLVGIASNPQGIGARVRVVADGLSQIRDVLCSAGNRSQNMTTVHFGLREAAVIDSMIIRWPSGLEQISTDLPVDQLFTVQEGGSVTDAPLASSARLALDVAPNPFNPVTTIQFVAPAGEQFRVAVYDLRGREIEVLLHGSGSGEEQRLTWAPRGLASGTYLVRLDVGRDVVARKLILVK